MYSYTDELTFKSNNGAFSDFIRKNGMPLFTDYHSLDREIILSEDSSKIRLGEKKCRAKISSIEELKKTFEDIVSDTVEIFNTQSFAPVHMYSFYLDPSNLKIELLVQQLIFDLLFDKYLNEAEKITLEKYSKQISSMLYADKVQRISAKDAIVKNIKRTMETYHSMIKNSLQIKNDLQLLDVDSDKYAQYYNPKLKENLEKKKPKYKWDFLYYNRNMITYRQYRRVLKKDSNYSYERFIMDLNEYNDFVTKLLPKDAESPEKYFNMSMDYYYLESYKRIDFICMLIDAMPKMRISEIKKEHFLVKRFHPEVVTPYEKNNELFFVKKCKYYRPLFLIEEALKKQIQANNTADHSNYAIQLFNHQIVRAKAYELFNYHYEYTSSDYREIKKFILHSYNMLSYHNENKLWSLIKGKSWNDFDSNTKQQLKLFLRNFVSINKALFWDSPKRKFKTPKSK